MKLSFPHPMMVAGHRGDSYNCFENTMAAFAMAEAAGADMIETDVRLTKDNVLILLHDDTVNRTTNGAGRAADLTYAELKELNAGNPLRPLQIPTLDEFLTWIKGTDLMLNLEFKEYYKPGNEDRCHLCIDEAIKLCKKHGMIKRMIFNSFDAHVLEYIHEMHPTYLLHGFYPYNIMFNVEGNPDEYLYCACLGDPRRKEQYDYLLERGIEPWIGASVTTQDALALCLSFGGRLITTNNPADTIQKLKNVGGRKD